jgi:glucokinase
MRTVLAVDVGGTAIKGAVIAEDGRVLWHDEMDTAVADGPDHVVRRVREMVSTLAGQPSAVDAVAVGVVVPGSVDAATGVARFAANIGWHDVPLRAMVADDSGLPTVLDHDVRAAGVAESRLGRTKDQGDSLLVVIGTGIAGLLMVGGRPVHGATGLAGEIGHLPIWPDGEPCPCGQRGCLERYASAAGISRRYQAATGRSADAAEIARIGSSDADARADGDADAARVWGEAVEALSLGFASCTMMFDPGVIVLSGGLSRAGAQLLDPVRRALAERVTWRPAPAVELSDLGAQGGLLGAAILAAGLVGIDDVTSWS